MIVQFSGAGGGGRCEWVDEAKKAREKENGLGKKKCFTYFNKRADGERNRHGSGSGNGGKNAKIRFVVACRGAVGSRHAAHVWQMHQSRIACVTEMRRNREKSRRTTFVLYSTRFLTLSLSLSLSFSLSLTHSSPNLHMSPDAISPCWFVSFNIVFK